MGCARGLGRSGLRPPRLRPGGNVAADAGRPLPGGSSYHPPLPSHSSPGDLRSGFWIHAGGKLRPERPRLARTTEVVSGGRPRTQGPAAGRPRASDPAHRQENSESSSPLQPPLPARPTFPTEPSLRRLGPGASFGRAPIHSARPRRASWQPHPAPEAPTFLFLGIIDFCFRHSHRPATHPRSPGLCLELVQG